MLVNREEDGRQFPFETERAYAGLHFVADDKYASGLSASIRNFKNGTLLWSPNSVARSFGYCIVDTEVLGINCIIKSVLFHVIITDYKSCFFT
jgi:hypothetical protein